MQPAWRCKSKEYDEIIRIDTNCKILSVRLEFLKNHQPLADVSLLDLLPQGLHLPIEYLPGGADVKFRKNAVAQVLQTCLPNHCHHTLFWLLRISFSWQKMSEAKKPRLACRNCNCPLTSQGHKVITKHAINL